MQRNATPIPSDTFLSIPSLILSSPELDLISVVLISDVWSFERKGQPYFRSIGRMAAMVRCDRRTVSRRLKELHDKGYLVVTRNNKSYNQTNTIEIGQRAIALIQPKVEPVPLEPPKPTPTPPQQQQPISKAQNEIQAKLKHADDMIPLDVFRSMDYNPKKDRHDLSKRDVEAVFALYGVPLDRVGRWIAFMDHTGWTVNDKLEAAKTGAVTLRDHADAYATPTGRFDYDDL